VECGTWRCPGDFGDRRGRLTPNWWKTGNTQYGLLTKWTINNNGCYINNIMISDTNLRDIKMDNKTYLSVRFGNKEDAEYIGGLNIFGRAFGDYEQDIVMIIEYK
jgi:predicted transcriptional regulator